MVSEKKPTSKSYMLHKAIHVTYLKWANNWAGISDRRRLGWGDGMGGNGFGCEGEHRGVPVTQLFLILTAVTQIYLCDKTV